MLVKNLDKSCAIISVASLSFVSSTIANSRTAHSETASRAQNMMKAYRIVIGYCTITLRMYKTARVFRKQNVRSRSYGSARQGGSDSRYHAHVSATSFLISEVNPSLSSRSSLLPSNLEEPVHPANFFPIIPRVPELKTTLSELSLGVAT